MPRYLHIPHTPDTARTLTLSGRNCLVVSGMITPPKIDPGAAVAIDPDQPTRILSTDKKAQKAGGLCLALKGVPVKPTDDVDVEKEYRLIPIDSLYTSAVTGDCPL